MNHGVMNSLIEFANIALLLGIIVAVIATTNWRAGVIASVIAAFALNYFGVEPVHSLRITSGDDILTIALLLCLGLTVSGLTAYRVRTAILKSHQADARLLHNQPLREMSSPVGASAVWDGLHSIVSHELDLITVQVISEVPAGLPQISSRPDSLIESPSPVVIPATGAFLSFNDPRFTQKILIRPKEGAGSVAIRRDLLLLFSRHLEAHREGILIS